MRGSNQPPVWPRLTFPVPSIAAQGPRSGSPATTLPAHSTVPPVLAHAAERVLLVRLPLRTLYMQQLGRAKRPKGFYEDFAGEDYNRTG